MSLTPTQADQLATTAARAPKIDAIWTWMGGGQTKTEFRQIRERLDAQDAALERIDALLVTLIRTVNDTHPA